MEKAGPTGLGTAVDVGRTAQNFDYHRQTADQARQGVAYADGSQVLV